MEKLLTKAMRGDLSPEESLRLLTGCREDNELSRRFVHLMQVESMTKLARKDDDDFSAEMAPRLKRGKILRWVAGWAAVAALDQRDASLLRLSLRLRLSLCLRLYLCFRLCLSVCLSRRFRRRLRRRKIRRLDRRKTSRKTSREVRRFRRFRK